MGHRIQSVRLLLTVALLALGCDRNIEPFVPGEEPVEPNLSKIFPAGAEQAAKGPPQRPGPPPQRGGRAAGLATSAPLQGAVSVAPDLAARVPAGAVLFVIARTGEAGPPLAVKRIGSPRFPVEFEIGPDDRMIQALPFTGPFRLSARLDSDGNAMTRTAGDLQTAASQTVGPGARGIALVLDEVLE